MSIRQRPDGMWEQTAQLFPGGRTYVSVTSDKPQVAVQVPIDQALRAFAEACFKAAAALRRASASATTGD